MDKSRTLLILHEIGIYGNIVLYYRAAIPEESIVNTKTDFREFYCVQKTAGCYAQFWAS